MRVSIITTIISIIIVILCAISSQNLTLSLERPTLIAGSFKGEFSVNANGAANYIINLDVPPGTASFEPDLSIVYDSQNPDGLLGQGFTLNGLSSITRCPANLKIDGYNGSIFFDSRDRFCLDGQRLITLGKDDYGKPGSIYHTENETFNKVIAENACGTGPCSFLVYNKKGWKFEFGTNKNSQVHLPNKKEIANWQVNKITDLHGNYISITYSNISNSLQNYPSEISYTANDQNKLVPLRKIKFNYEDIEPDQIMPKYIGGFAFYNTKKLKNIYTEVSGKQTLNYKFSYDDNPGQPKVLLTQIQKCGLGEQCLKPIIFKWSKEANDVRSPNSRPDGRLTLPANWCTGQNSKVEWSDFNGDGMLDVFCSSSSLDKYKVLISTGSDLKSPNNRVDGALSTPSGWCQSSTATITLIDFNGDRKADLACNNQEKGLQQVLISTGYDVKSPNSRADGTLSTPANWCTNSCHVSWGNFTGTGRTDILCNCKNGTISVLTSDGTDVRPLPGTGSAGIIKTDWCVDSQNNTTSVSLVDFNGDGLVDFHCRNITNGDQKIMLSTGKSLISPNNRVDGFIKSNWCIGNDKQIYSVDYNGDSISDMHCASKSGQHLLLLSTGTGLSPLTHDPSGILPLPNNWCSGDNINLAWADFNGDGYNDIHCKDNSGNYLIMLANGNKLKSPNSRPDGLIKPSWCAGIHSMALPIDFNGDAMNDISCNSPQGNKESMMIHLPNRYGLIESIQDGGGSITNINYEPITHPTVYQKTKEAAYPVVSIQTPLYVVITYDVLDGKGGTYKYKYRYQGAKTDLDSRKWLGFENIEITNINSGKIITNSYKQEYPAIGFLYNKNTLLNGVILENTDYKPLIKNVYPNIYQVLIESETDSIYESGGLAYQNKKNYEYDDYGNIIIFSDLGDPTTLSDDVFKCFRYKPVDESWRVGYIEAEKITRTRKTCQNFITNSNSAWDSTNDIWWNKLEYDSNMEIINDSTWDNQSNKWLTASKTYDEFGNINGIIDYVGNKTIIEYDQLYKTFESIRFYPPLEDNLVLKEYTEFEPFFGKIISLTDVNKNQIKYVYDCFGRVLEQYGPEPDGSSNLPDVLIRKTLYGEDSKGFYISHKLRANWSDNDLNNWFEHRSYYDCLGRLSKTVEKAEENKQVVQQFIYDNQGRKWKKSYPYFSDTSPDWIAISYDVYDRPQVITYPNNIITKNEYKDSERKVVTTTAANTQDARISTDIANSRGKIIISKYVNGGRTLREFDPISQLTQLTNPNGVIEKFFYDSLGRIIKIDSGDSGLKFFNYGDDGRLKTSIDANNNMVTFDYDALGRMIKKTLTNNGSKEEEVITLQYDQPEYKNSLGKLTSVTQDFAKHEYSYTPYGKILAEKLSIEGMEYVHQMEYDARGEDTLLTYPDGSQLKTQYDIAGNISCLSFKENEGKDFISYANYKDYNALKHPQQIEYGNGVITSYSYYTIRESLGKLKNISITDTSQPIQALDYQWNAANQIKEINTTKADSVTQTETFAYNSMGWLEEANGPYGTLNFQYDLSSNITKKNNINYNYLSGSNKIVSGDNNLKLSYDNNGNVTSKSLTNQNWQYEYDGYDLLTKVKNNDAIIMQAKYDFNGSRLQRIDSNGNVSEYISSDYEVLKKDGKILHTKYISSVNGLAATITKDLSSPEAIASFKNGAKNLQLKLYKDLSITGIINNIKNNFWSTLNYKFILLMLVCIIIAISLIKRTSLIKIIGKVTSKVISSINFKSLTSFIIIISIVINNLIPIQAFASLVQDEGYPSPGVLYFHADQIGNIILTTNENGQKSSSVSYEPYGFIDQANSEGEDNFRPKFTAKELDYPTSLYYFESRIYDPELARFLSPDNQDHYLSPYTYVKNDPVNLIDPTGENPIIAVIAFTVVGLVTGAYFGGVVVNHNDYNPITWNWGSSRTMGGIFAGAAIGAVGGALGGALSEAGVAVGITGDIVIAAAENTAFSALGGMTDPKDLLISAGEGALAGLAASGVALSLSNVGSRFARRAEGGLEALEAGEKRGSFEIKNSNQVCRFSFPAGTKVTTSEGFKNIEDVRINDEVLSYNINKTDQIVVGKVKQVYKRNADELIVISLEKEIIKTTPEHPLLVQSTIKTDKKCVWLTAESIKKGDHLCSIYNKTAKVESVLREKTSNNIVFNFEVDNNSHNYLVSEYKIIAHNVLGKDCITFESGKKRPSWKSGISGTKETLIRKQTDKTTGLVESAVSKQKYAATHKISVGKKERKVSIWQIDHVIPYRHLLEASKKTKAVISAEDLRNISNDVSNLRLLTAPENTSHAFEPKDVVGEAGAIKILQNHGLWK